VRPDEGNFESKLRGISESDRQALLQDVLSSGCADPNFPLIYWSNPAVHASFEGDVAALETLRANGCTFTLTLSLALALTLTTGAPSPSPQPQPQPQPQPHP
jgi:hypothetical protein